MNAAERRELRRVKAQFMAGDRAGGLASLRKLLEPGTTRSLFRCDGQLVLRFVVFRCDTLDGEEVPALVCVARQAATDIQRTTQTSRGQGTEYPLCDSRKCEQGRAIREALDPEHRITWRGAGPGGRFERGAKDVAGQEAAKARARRAGLLESVRTLDVDPDPSPVEE